MVIKEKRLDSRVAKSCLDELRRGVQISVNTQYVGTTFQHLGGAFAPRLKS